MKRSFLVVFLLSSFLLNAHPPRSIDVSYDGAKAALSVKAWHNVDDPEHHFIKRIVVLLGDETIAEKTYERQQSNEFQEEIFSFSAKPLQKGDAVKVRAFCSLFGKKTVDLKWPE